MVERRRLSINLPGESYAELKALAKSTDRTMTEVIRTALGLVRIAMEEEKKNHTLAVSDAHGEVVLKQIVLP